MSTPTISAAALQAVADHGVPVDPGAQYGVEVARHCTTEALIAALRERGIALAFTRAEILAAVRKAWDLRSGNPIIALETVLEALGMGAHVVSRDGHATLVDEPERTPLVVLRAMLAAYEKAAVEAFTAASAVAGTDFGAWASLEQTARTAWVRVHIVASALGIVLAGCELHPALLAGLRADYEARLAGTRPLDAPPLATK